MDKIVRIMWVPLLLSFGYTGWIFWQRHIANSAQQDLPAWSANPMAAYGNSVKILGFYTKQREIDSHQEALVCYGVVNAAAVRLDPPVEKVWPAVTRCFQVTPAKSTRYTLTAESAEHTTVSESIDIAVRRK
jgi:hypothetical protein